MFLKFNEIKFRNILSYGNNFTTINLKNGLNLIKAQNGSGKSTILDAINFCLFGKPFRNIKMSQLINKYNDKELEVIINFNIGNDNYEIKRGLKPVLFELKKNGILLDNLSSKKLNQEEINKLIGINEKIFKNIVGIAVTNSKPFLGMTLGEKRTLIESIFNIDVLSEMQKDVKKQITLDNSEQRIKITELDGVNNRLNDNTLNMSKVKEYIENFEENKKIQLSELNKNIEELEKRIKQNIKNIKIGNDKINGFIENDIPSDEEYTILTKNIGKIENEKKNIEKTLKTLEENKLCPICNTELNSEHAKKHINSLKKQLKVIDTSTIPNLKKLELEYNNKRNEYKKQKDFINEIKFKVQEQILNKKNYENTLNKLKIQINELKEKICDFSLNEYINKDKELKEQIMELNNIIEKLNHKLEIDNKLIEILSDDGIRMYFFKKLLPIMNNKINFYLQKFELPITIEFDNFMNETIKTGKFVQDYNQFSGGEKSRIDMAILLTFFDISKIISNWSCSILFIDEILDGGVDQNGIEQFISALFNVISENNKNLGIYIISHKLSEIQVSWNNIIEIEKKSIFSEIKCIN